MRTSLEQSEEPDCRREHGIVLAAIPETPGTCRAVVRAALRVRGLAEIADEAETVVTELSSNAVRAAQGEPGTGDMPTIVLVLSWREHGLRIEVWDRAPGVPVLREPDFEAEHGRGLFLVNEITGGRWGCQQAKGSKCVWAELGEGHA